MTRDDILRLAREAGIEQWWDKANACQDTYEAALAHFAELVAAAEREACAKVCEEDTEEACYWSSSSIPGKVFALTIRARGAA